LPEKPNGGSKNPNVASRLPGSSTVFPFYRWTNAGRLERCDLPAAIFLVSEKLELLLSTDSNNIYQRMQQLLR
jgi:hypothetical protein